MNNLIETKQSVLKLIKEAEEQFAGTGKALLDIEDYVAEYLTANGVIVPPCKVGDVVWIPSVNSNRVYSKPVKEILIHEKDGEIGKYIYCSSAYFPFENIGKTVFLSRDEAEKALAERKEK